ncbi:unnamed protein product [Trichobilharzia regenti]|nr:unnamed protein product [Trichobilharzia regenti]
MTDEQNRILRVVDKKYSTFCTKEAIERNPLYLSDLTEPQQFWGDVVVRLCSGFASKKHQLGFLDCILKTGRANIVFMRFNMLKFLGLPFNEAAIKQIISFLLDLFQNICESQSSYDAHYDSMLNCCAQLMVYYSNSVECLIGCAVLFIHLIKLERQQNYLTEILNTINESVDSSVCLTSDSENLQFLSKLFCSDKHRSQLAVLLAITGIMSSDDWLESYINYGSQSVYILYVVGFTVETSSQQQYDRKDSVINLLLSKLVYNWSKKNLSSSVVSDSGKNTAHHSHIPMDSLVIFCLEMRSNPIDAIRYSALDTFENIIVYHLNVCNECRRPRSASETTTTTTTATTTGDCKPKISCDYLNEIFSRIVCDTCYSRGTIAVLTSLVRCIFKKSHYKIIDLLHTLSSVFGTSGRDVCEQVVSGLMKMANDPNLASSISELYTLIAQKIFTEKELSKKPLKSSFPDTLLHQSDPSYQCTFNQNILPDLMKANHKLLELLVQSCNIELGIIIIITIITSHFQL